MRIAQEDPALDHLTVLYPGNVRYEIEDRVTVVPLAELAGGADIFAGRGLRTRARRRR